MQSLRRILIIWAPSERLCYFINTKTRKNVCASHIMWLPQRSERLSAQNIHAAQSACGPSHLLVCTRDNIIKLKGRTKRMAHRCSSIKRLPSSEYATCSDCLPKLLSKFYLNGFFRPIKWALEN
jgi:hypothetical protein